MKNRSRDLPNECWEMIFILMGNHQNLESVSLVCKNFLSITNSIRNRFNIVEPTFLIHRTFSPFFRRFHNLTSISLVHFHGDLNETLIQIAASDLKIETLDISRNNSFPADGLARLGKDLKVLICNNMKNLRDPELAVIANSFPLLEELDVSYDLLNYSTSSFMITDSGIEHLVSRVTNLRKIDISSNINLTEISILAILSNCIHLNEIKFHNCYLIFHNCSRFRCLSTDYDKISPLVLSSNRALSSLHICSSLISDDFLINLANAGFPLKKLTLHVVMSTISSFTFCGLSILLQTYQSLDYLSLTNLRFLDDSLMGVLSAYFSCLITVKIVGCLKLTVSTLFMLTKNCPCLEDIEMRVMKGVGNHFIPDSVENPRIKSLNLSSSFGLIDKWLIQLSLICTKLEKLVVLSCPRIRDKGLEQILNKCKEISHLNICNCQKVTSIGMGGVLENMKIIVAGTSNMDDNGLRMIGTRCTELERLNVVRCDNITGDGLVEMARNCKKMKYINMHGTRNVSTDTFDLIVLSMPSLVKVVPPSGSSFTFDFNRDDLPLEFKYWAMDELT